jgi:hypothetical protein
MGGARKAWTVAAVMPGNRRNVAEGVQLGCERPTMRVREGIWE